MEGIEMEEGLIRPIADTMEDGDFCNSILSRFSTSPREDHQHLCAVIGAMSQEFKDQNIPSTPVAYFGATCSSLDRLFSEPEPASHVVEALLTILSLLLRSVSVAILKKKRGFVSGLVVRFLQSSWLTVGAASSGLKCLSHFLIIRDGDNWSEISQLYGILMGFVVDSRIKVRRQAHLCLRFVLEKFQGTSLVAPASEGITNLFERFYLLAGGSNSNSSEGPKGAQEILHILDALKECLALMSTKYTTTLLKYFKNLLELHQPFVTRRLTDSLLLLCLNPDAGVSAQALLDILCSLALSVTTKETSVDGMAFTARLLDVGMVKVYSVNRQICVVKLPVVFNALRDILASEHEEATHAAVNTFKNLIHTCIDESLIKQGVDEIKMADLNMDSRKSGPTIIEKVCAMMESLLGYLYTPVLDLVFQVISSMFDKLGEASFYLMRGILKSLADVQKLPDEDFPFRKQLHECIGSALGAMGAKNFLSLLPLNLKADDLSEVNVWLFPILKRYTVGSSLNFFREEIYSMIGLMRQKSEKLKLQGRVSSSRSADALLYSLWSFLPSFCNYPLDTAESLKDLEKVLCSTLDEEPDLRGIICSSLQILIQQNKKFLENGNEASDMSDSDVGFARQQVMAYYTQQMAANNLTALKLSSHAFLPVLSSVFLKSTKDDGGSLQSTIAEFASISEKKDISSFFRSKMQELLKVTQKVGKAENSVNSNSNSMQIDDPLDESSPQVMRARLFDLVVSLLPGLNIREVELLFTAIRPALQDREGLIQKKAYKVLSIILRTRDEFLSSKFEDLLKDLEEALLSCHFSAKRHRLDCLYFLIVHVSKANRWSNITSSFLTEIILALKEANKKTRNRAYDILVQIGHAFGDEEKGGKKENLFQFFNMVAGGLTGETSYMISAAVKGLARLVYEFSDLVSTACNLLPSTFLLLQRKNREIIKANLGLLKVLVAKSKAEGLQLHLRSMVEGILMWQDESKTHFKAKVKLLLEMLVKKCGLDAVKAVMPEEHMKLLTNIRKIKERKERKLSAPSEEARSQVSRATTSRQSRWNHTKIFSDFGDEEAEDSDAEYMDEKTVSGGQGKSFTQFKSKASTLRSRKGKNLPAHLFDQAEDEPLDLLDRHRTRSALRSQENLKRRKDSDDEMELDSDGRLVIHEGGKPKKEKPFHAESDTRSEAGSKLSANSKKTKKRQKTSESGWAYTGSEYATKKASGDVKKKDKLEPYAYWPLDRKMMSRRPEHRTAAKKGMASVVKMTKKLQGKSASSLLSGGLKFKRSHNHKKSGKKKSK